MPRVRVLPPDLANQIAAGEVVDRPASVVKELVENAIDANARRLTIAIEHGGKALIRVEDDGEGMEPEDAVVALERHATSKIGAAADLDAIATLGFRGEALPSIASVSRFRVRTRAAGLPTGYEIRIEGGAEVFRGEVGAPEGTLVEVADLFHNLPARRKFQKSDAAESAQVSRIVMQLALAYPEVGFVLLANGRRVLTAPPASSVRERFFQVIGDRPELLEVKREGGGMRVEGYIAPLAEQGVVRGPQNVFVNRRIVRDRTISHAIAQAYSVATIKERSPEVHLFLTLAPRRVDVNVHPTKAEVRFLEPSLVHEVVRRAIADALGAGMSPELRLRPEVAADTATAPALPQMFGTRPEDRVTAFVAQVGAGGLSAFPMRGAGTIPESEEPTTDADARQAAVDAVKPMTPLGQFRDTFIIAVDSEGLSIVDQHVAHERILFEQIHERLVAGRLESQRLLTPRVFELGPAAREALAARAQELDRLGFEVDGFGGDAVRVSAVPALIKPDAVEGVLRALAQDIEGLDSRGGLDEPLGKLAATTACHAAVKANDRLTPEQMQYLLDELRRTAYSTVCPHGRPVVLRLTRREIERNFQRI
jgi:DNA mismatch repair protein MutL